MKSLLGFFFFPSRSWGSQHAISYFCCQLQYPQGSRWVFLSYHKTELKIYCSPNWTERDICIFFLASFFSGRRSALCTITVKGPAPNEWGVPRAEQQEIGLVHATVTDGGMEWEVEEECAEIRFCCTGDSQWPQPERKVSLSCRSNWFHACSESNKGCI